jgi:hypothetical protein
LRFTDSFIKEPELCEIGFRASWFLWQLVVDKRIVTPIVKINFFMI